MKLLPALLLLAGADALAQVRAPLHQLSAGSKVLFPERFLIPANVVTVPIPSPGRLRCSVTMREPRAVTRVVPPNREFEVTRVESRGMSQGPRLFAWTYVYLDSKSIEAIVCSKEGYPNTLPTIEEFQVATGSVVRLDIDERLEEVG